MKQFKYKNELKEAFSISIPVMMGYVVLGFAFGLLLVSSGYDWHIAVLMSIFIYAGALQFLAINFLNVKAGLVDIAIASLFINIRQSFYGLSLLNKYKNTKPFKKYLIFGLTDETYALLTTIQESKNLEKKFFYLFITALNQSYWVIGTFLGSIVGATVSFNTKGLEFSLTALFIVLAIEQYKNLRKLSPFIIGILSASMAIVFIPSDKMLLGAIVISLILLLLNKKKIEN